MSRDKQYMFTKVFIMKTHNNHNIHDGTIPHNLTKYISFDLHLKKNAENIFINQISMSNLL